MENNVKVHFRWSPDWQLRMLLECPICTKQQELAFDSVATGEEFTCECGEDIRLTPGALLPVRHELDELQHLIQKTVTLPV